MEDPAGDKGALSHIERLVGEEHQLFEQKLEPDQNPDREHDREQEVALFHLGRARILPGSASRLGRNRVVAAAAPRVAA